MVAAVGTVLLAAEAKEGDGLTVFAAGSVSVLLLLALASIVSNAATAAWHAERTAYNTQRAAEELVRLSGKSRHSGSPAKAGTN